MNPKFAYLIRWKKIILNFCEPTSKYNHFVISESILISFKNDNEVSIHPYSNTLLVIKFSSWSMSLTPYLKNNNLIIYLYHYKEEIYH